jgi:hypothetical protein
MVKKEMVPMIVTDLPCPPSVEAEDRSIVALKRHMWDFVHQQTMKEYYEDDQEDDYGDPLVISQLVSAEVIEHDTNTGRTITGRMMVM